jgi:hypothetical protein
MDNPIETAMSCRKAHHVGKPTCMGASHRDISWLKCAPACQGLLHSFQQFIELLKCIKYHPLGGPFPHIVCSVSGRANQWMLPKHIITPLQGIHLQLHSDHRVWRVRGSLMFVCSTCFLHSAVAIFDKTKV